MADAFKPVRAAATSPGHITGFFAIHDQGKEAAKKGSRGAGLCTDVGAVTIVDVAPSDTQRIEVFVDRAASPAPVTSTAVVSLLREAALGGKIPFLRDAPKGERADVHVRVYTDLSIPVGQGLGASGAGAFSAALALARALRLGRSDALVAAHEAEIKHRTGLGDVVAMAHGGYEIRARPGLPPWGAVTTFLGYGDLVLCPMGGGLSTTAVLSDRAQRAKVNEVGTELVDRLLRSPSPELFMELSHEFADRTGLMTPEVREAVEAARAAGGMASMAMLGTCVFSIGEAEAVAEALAPYGTVIRASVEPRPARLLEIEDAPSG